MDGGVDRQLQSSLNEIELRRLNVTEKFGSKRILSGFTGLTIFTLNHFILT